MWKNEYLYTFSVCFPFLFTASYLGSSSENRTQTDGKFNGLTFPHTIYRVFHDFRA